MKSEAPLACNMDVFTPVQRDFHIQNTLQLAQAVHGVNKVENGYEFIFPNLTDLISKIAEFIAHERMCCPFLKFTLEVSSDSGPVSLVMTGPEGTQEFLRAEFNGVIQ